MRRCLRNRKSTFRGLIILYSCSSLLFCSVKFNTCFYNTNHLNVKQLSYVGFNNIKQWYFQGMARTKEDQQGITAQDKITTTQRVTEMPMLFSILDLNCCEDLTLPDNIVLCKLSFDVIHKPISQLDIFYSFMLQFAIPYTKLKKGQPSGNNA